MCGIIGYLGKKRKCKDILQKLKRLEYRGYDSAGVAFINDGNVIQKFKGHKRFFGAVYDVKHS